MYFSRFYEKTIDGHTTLTFGLRSYISISVHVFHLALPSPALQSADAQSAQSVRCSI